MQDYDKHIFRELSTEMHHSVVETFMEEARKADMNPVLKNEVDLDENDIEDKDLVVSLGGDSTYLQAAGTILNSNVPLLGINSYPTLRTGFLTNLGVDKKFMHK